MKRRVEWVYVSCEQRGYVIRRILRGSRDSFTFALFFPKVTKTDCYQDICILFAHLLHQGCVTNEETRI